MDLLLTSDVILEIFSRYVDRQDARRAHLESAALGRDAAGVEDRRELVASKTLKRRPALPRSTSCG